MAWRPRQTSDNVATIHDQKLVRGNGGELHQIAEGGVPVLTTAQGGPCCQVLHHGRQLGSRRQQHSGLLYPGCIKFPDIIHSVRIITLSCRNRRSSTARRLRQSGRSTSSTITSKMTMSSLSECAYHHSPCWFFLHTAKIFPGEGQAGIVRAGKQNLEKVHGDRSLTNNQRSRRPRRSLGWPGAWTPPPATPTSSRG